MAALRGENIPRATGRHKPAPGRWRCHLCDLDGTGDWDALRRHMLSHYRPDEHGIWRTT